MCGQPNGSALPSHHPVLPLCSIRVRPKFKGPAHPGSGHLHCPSLTLTDVTLPSCSCNTAIALSGTGSSGSLLVLPVRRLLSGPRRWRGLWAWTLGDWQNLLQTSRRLNLASGPSRVGRRGLTVRPRVEPGSPAWTNEAVGWARVVAEALWSTDLHDVLSQLRDAWHALWQGKPHARVVTAVPDLLAPPLTTPVHPTSAYTTVVRKSACALSFCFIVL